MSIKTEEFLYLLLWSADTLMRPSWQNLDQSFERWAYRNGLGARVAELARQKLLERAPGPDCRRIVRLTEAGRQAALGGRDPEERWNRNWDGCWRMIAFDIPEKDHALRLKLWRYLRSHHFGFLQNSLWVTPDSVESIKTVIQADLPAVESFIMLEASPCGGESDTNLVSGAWDFGEINRRYQRCRRLLDRDSRPKSSSAVSSWARLEMRAWRNAVQIDPLLPKALLPPDYLGEITWAERKAAVADVATRAPGIAA